MKVSDGSTRSNTLSTRALVRAVHKPVKLDLYFESLAEITALKQLT